MSIDLYFIDIVDIVDIAMLINIDLIVLTLYIAAVLEQLVRAFASHTEVRISYLTDLSRLNR